MSMIDNTLSSGPNIEKCPHDDCNTLAQQILITHPPQYTPDLRTKIYDEITATRCAKCKKMAYWVEGSLVYPSNKTNLPAANRDMPDDIKEIYKEASDIFGVSPRAATALLRLGIKKLEAQLDGDGRQISNQIDVLINQELPEGASSQTAQRIDISTEILLPPTLSSANNRRIAKALFISLNTIVERIVSEKKMQNDAYDYRTRKN